MQILIVHSGVGCLLLWAVWLRGVLQANNIRGMDLQHTMLCMLHAIQD